MISKPKSTYSKYVPNYLIESMYQATPNAAAKSSEEEKKRVPLPMNENLNTIPKFANLRLNFHSNLTKRGVKGLAVLTSSALLFKLVSSNAIRQTVNQFFLQNPYICAFLMCSMKGSSADFIAQKISMRTQQNAKFEYKRNLAFLVFGGAYQGCVNEYIFNHVYPSLFGSGTDILTISMKVLVDQLFTSPCICLPIAYIVKGGLYNKSVTHSIKRYMHDIKENKLLIKSRTFWGPTQIVSFLWIPEHFRISFIAFIGFFWNIILSSISGKQQDEAKSS